MTRAAAVGANLSAHAIAFSMGYSGETAMKTEDDLASGILLLATIETLLVVLSRMLSAPTEPQAQNSLARYRLQARKAQQVRLRLYPGSERCAGVCWRVSNSILGNSGWPLGFL